MGNLAKTQSRKRKTSASTLALRDRWSASKKENEKTSHFGHKKAKSDAFRPSGLQLVDRCSENSTKHKPLRTRRKSSRLLSSPPVEEVLAQAERESAQSPQSEVMSYHASNISNASSNLSLKVCANSPSYEVAHENQPSLFSINIEDYAQAEQLDDDDECM